MTLDSPKRKCHHVISCSKYKYFVKIVFPLYICACVLVHTMAGPWKAAADGAELSHKNSLMFYSTVSTGSRSLWSDSWIQLLTTSHRPSPLEKRKGANSWGTKAFMASGYKHKLSMSSSIASNAAPSLMVKIQWTVKVRESQSRHSWLF